jgi:hypothetical protein
VRRGLLRFGAAPTGGAERDVAVGSTDPGVLAPLRCDVCGEVHSGPVLDIAFKRPDPYLRLEDGERARCKITEDLCAIPGRSWHVRGVLQLPLTDHPDVGALGVWCSVPEAAFERYRQRYDDPAQADEPPFRGTVSTDMGVLPETEGLDVEIRLVSAKDRPAVRLLDPSHPLQRQQSQGITVQDWFRIRHAILGS